MYASRNLLPALMIVCLSLLLASCGLTGRVGSRSAESGAAEGNRPVRPGAMIEEGVASWYGPNFHGKLTANGEKYNMNRLTAAHRTLPFDTVVRVENSNNGESVVVRINDRGPYVDNRIIDLSRKAAEEIEMLGPGTAPVRLYLVEGALEESRMTELDRPTYTLQLGSYTTREKALAHAGKVAGARVEEVPMEGETIYRVYYGIYLERADAEKELEELARNGVEGGYVKQLEN